MRELAAQVGDPNRRQHGLSRALGHLDARPGGTVIRATAAAVEGLGRRRGGTQHERAAVAARHLGSHLTCVVARAGTLLVAGLMLLIDDDETKVAERAKKAPSGRRRPRARHRWRPCPTGPSARRPKGASGRPRPSRQNASGSRPDGLGRQRNLGHQHAGRATAASTRSMAER